MKDGGSQTLYLSCGTDALKNCRAASAKGDQFSLIDHYGCERRRTLSQDIHWIIDLDIHVVTDSRQFIFLAADDLVVLALNLPS